MTEVDSGSTIVERDAYDGTGRRIQIFSNYTGGTPGTTVDEYQSGQQTIETRNNSAVQYQYVWSPRYIDARSCGTRTAAVVIQTAQRIFYLGDANYNVTAL